MDDVLSRLPFAKAPEKKSFTILNNNHDNISFDAKLTGLRLLDILWTPCLCELESNSDLVEAREWHDESWSSEYDRELEQDLYEIEHEIKAEYFEGTQSTRSLEIAVFIVNFPISRDEITAHDFIVKDIKDLDNKSASFVGELLCSF